MAGLKSARKSHRQLELSDVRGWGGRRRGAGRKRQAPRRRVEHRQREVLGRALPIHVTVRIRPGLGRLRGFKQAAVLRGVFAACSLKTGFRICEFSVQGNHLHLIVEASNNRSLSLGMQGFNRCLAGRLNRFWGRSGSVCDDRYHMQPLRSPRQVKRALGYVLHNAHKHRERLPGWSGGVDPFSSAWTFDGWTDDSFRRAGRAPPARPGPPITRRARTWLLTTGWWTHHGLLDPSAKPARPARRRG